MPMDFAKREVSVLRVASLDRAKSFAGTMDGACSTR